MRFGENALEVIDAVKEKIKTIEAGLPEGVVIRTAYDRSSLIHRSIDTLKQHAGRRAGHYGGYLPDSFLLHVRSGLVAAAVLPLGILGSFIAMKLCGINANIMSMSGIAVAIGTMVDSSIVMVEKPAQAQGEDARREPLANS